MVEQPADLGGECVGHRRRQRPRERERGEYPRLDTENRHRREVDDQFPGDECRQIECGARRRGVADDGDERDQSVGQHVLGTASTLVLLCDAAFGLAVVPKLAREPADPEEADQRREPAEPTEHDRHESQQDAGQHSRHVRRLEGVRHPTHQDRHGESGHHHQRGDGRRDRLQQPQEEPNREHHQCVVVGEQRRPEDGSDHRPDGRQERVRRNPVEPSGHGVDGDDGRLDDGPAGEAGDDERGRREELVVRRQPDERPSQPAVRQRADGSGKHRPGHRRLRHGGQHRQSGRGQREPG